MQFSFDPERSTAILLGASRFDHDKEYLPSIPSVKSNIARLRDLLVDKEIVGIPSERVVTMLDPRDVAQTLLRIDELVGLADDMILFYYAGHGIVGRNTFELHLALSDTIDEKAEILALPYIKIRNMLKQSPASKKIVLLDCCFSGRALNHALATESSIIRTAIDDEISKGRTLSLPLRRTSLPWRRQKNGTPHLLVRLSVCLSKGSPMKNRRSRSGTCIEVSWPS